MSSAVPNGSPRILILKTGSTFPTTRRRFGDFDRWFLDALQSSPASFHVCDVVSRRPQQLEEYDGVIVTGSPAAAYDREEWLEVLEATLRDTVERGQALLAVCFGAQVLASALGGSVVPSPLGWEIGTVQVELEADAARDPLLGPAAPDPRFQATHRDLIETLPAGAVVLAGNAASPVQAFRVGDCAWGTQFHPEVTPGIVEDLIRTRRNTLQRSTGPTGPLGETGYRELLGAVAPTPSGRTILESFVRLAGSSRR
jgi:GMP synthase (glutamine-hydrolysing)